MSGRPCQARSRQLSAEVPIPVVGMSDLALGQGTPHVRVAPHPTPAVPGRPTWCCRRADLPAAALCLCLVRRSPLASAVTGVTMFVDNGLNTMGLATDSKTLDQH